MKLWSDWLFFLQWRPVIFDSEDNGRVEKEQLQFEANFYPSEDNGRVEQEQLQFEVNF